MAVSCDPPQKRLKFARDGETGATVDIMAQKGSLLEGESLTTAVTPKGDAEEIQQWMAGERVYAFYNIFNHPRGFRCVCIHQKVGRPSPLAGLSAGWLPARVVDECRPSETEDVSLRFEGCFADPMMDRDKVSSETFRVPHSLVRRRRPQDPPALSILVVRWFDYYTLKGYSDFDIRREGSVRDFFTGDSSSGDESVDRSMMGDYEAFTVFIRRSEDLDRLSEVWARAELRGRHVGAMYYLWPVQKSHAEAVQPAYVCEHALFGLMQRMELAGVPTRYPHPAHLYRQLAGKLWVPQMSLSRAHAVPPTTRLHLQQLAADPDAAAGKALEALEALAVLGQSCAPAGSCRGVAKLGFSWCGSDVEAFQGRRQLGEKAQKLFGKPQSAATSLLVQSMVPNVVCELRCLVFYDRASSTHQRRLVYLCEEEGRQNDAELGFSLTTHLTMTEARALEVCFRGDGEAQRAAREEVHRLTTAWLMWMLAECCEPQPQNRLDFLVSYDPAKPGSVAVHTCEVTEGGSSLCGLRADARTCAYLNAFFADGACAVQGCRCRCPRALPPLKSKY